MHNYVRLQHGEDDDNDMKVRERAALFDNNDDAALFNLESDSSENCPLKPNPLSSLCFLLFPPLNKQ